MKQYYAAYKAHAQGLLQGVRQLSEQEARSHRQLLTGMTQLKEDDLRLSWWRKRTPEEVQVRCQPQLIS